MRSGAGVAEPGDGFQSRQWIDSGGDGEMEMRHQQRAIGEREGFHIPITDQSGPNDFGSEFTKLCVSLV